MIQNAKFNLKEIEIIKEYVKSAVDDCIDEFGDNFDDNQAWDHFQQIMIDYLDEQHNIVIDRDEDRDFIYDLIDEVMR